MGKALVINGLSVTAPLTTITFKNSASVLRNYYLANSSISELEKSALEAFITAILNADLWGKVKYFYPMLGTSVTEQLLDVVNYSTDDFLGVTDQTGLSISSRNLQIIGRTGNYTCNSSGRLSLLDENSISVITAIKASSFSDTKGMYIGHFEQTIDGKGFNLRPIIESPYYYPQLELRNATSTINIPISSAAAGNQSTYLERILCGTLNDATLSLYKDKILYASAENTITPLPINTVYRVLRYDNTNVPVNMNFISVATGLSESEWSIFYDSLLLFLKAVGKHI